MILFERFAVNEPSKMGRISNGGVQGLNGGAHLMQPSPINIAATMSRRSEFSGEKRTSRSKRGFLRGRMIYSLA